MIHQTTNQKADFIHVHEFDAPKELVFKAFSTAEALNEWWGPVESCNTVLQLDFQPGGIFHYQMETKGRISYGRFIFGEIKPFDLLEFTNAFADENAQIVKAPFDLELPLEIFYRLTFAENQGKTTVTLTGQPVNASTEQEDVFKSINNDMRQGFGATFNQLSAYLKNQKTI
jgi:uncharacterized protein YndB with AHSA1/START domain